MLADLRVSNEPRHNWEANVCCDRHRGRFETYQMWRGRGSGGEGVGIKQSNIKVTRGGEGRRRRKKDFMDVAPLGGEKGTEKGAGTIRSWDCGYMVCEGLRAGFFDRDRPARG